MTGITVRQGVGGSVSPLAFSNHANDVTRDHPKIRKMIIVWS